MGNYLSSPRNIPEGRGTKRKREEDNCVEESERDKIQEENLNTPKRKRLQSTTRYIYETLFVNGQTSDVKIIALGKEWHLHKVYLCQSGYFASMFRGSWRESHQDLIRMEIPDCNIDIGALDIAFGSLYKDDVLIKPTKVISVLAAATLLSLEDLISQCANLMVETVSAKTICHYHTASVMYGQSFVTTTCIDWLEKNLMSSQNIDLLKEIPPSLMTEVISSPSIFVMQVEMDIYSMLKKWMYLSLFPMWLGTLKDLVQEADAFYRSSPGDYFLDTDRGGKFKETFNALRLQHIINDLSSANIVEQDRIMPKRWMLPVYRSQWLQMLRIEQGQDKGPGGGFDSEILLREGLRCGRILKKDGPYCWRWTGYNYGVDLLVSFSSRLLIFKRNTMSQSCHGSVSLQTKRHVHYKLTVSTFNKLGQTTYHRTTGIKKLSLGKDEEVIVMSVDRKVQFPLHISCNFLVFTPNDTKAIKDSRLETQCPSASTPGPPDSDNQMRQVGSDEVNIQLDDVSDDNGNNAYF